MIVYYYAVCALIATILSTIYIFNWRKRFDVNITAFFILMPLMQVAYFLTYFDSDSSLTAQKIIYFGGTFLPWFITLCVASLCKIEIKRIVRLTTFAFNMIVYICVLTIGYLPIFYRDYSIERTDGHVIIHKEYGPAHTVFYLLIIIYLLIGIGIITVSYRKKKEVSRRILFLLFIPEVVSIIAFFSGHLIKTEGLEFMPVAYIITGVTYLFIARRISLYEVTDMVIESMVESGKTGFILLDYRLRYLGSNEAVKRIMPEIRDLSVDDDISASPAVYSVIYPWIEAFTSTEAHDTNIFEKKDPGTGESEFYSVKISALYDGRIRRGYQIFLSDDTQSQKYIHLIDNYNSKLSEEVTQKTDRLENMQGNLLLGMATMVESRDNSTGGHIKRTSDCVRILTDEIMKDNSLWLSDSFCRNIVKAAPMHDLGKISVDDSILKKPGRFTSADYEEMKVHTTDGAKIVHEILREYDDKEFRTIAENVAHYHHERMDGSGYPEGLKGNDIPFEARIMAIADVYDALVSKRIYKEKMSFEEADRIILDGMGTQFDPYLRKYYEAARPKLEEYYRSVEQ